MNSRTLLIILLVFLLGVGAILTIAELFKEAPAPARMTPAIAAVQIEPYTVITQDMIKAGTEVRQSEAVQKGLYPADAVVGKMATDLIVPNTLISGVNAKPIEEVRFVEDLGLEVVSFQAGVDRLVGGKLRPGHIINLYGYGRDDETRKNYTTMIEPRLWVVNVSQAGRDVEVATPQPDVETGEYSEVIGGQMGMATLITVATEPQRAMRIIDALGAQGLQAWVTLAANQTVDFTRAATPAATARPPATPGLPLDLALTATALWKQINSTPAARPPRTGFGGSR